MIGSFASAVFVALVSVMAWSWSVSAAIETIALQPIADTTLIEVAPLNNLGGAVFVNAGTAGNGNRHRGLFLFDVSSVIPAGSTITRAELTMDVVRQPSTGSQDSNFVLHRMLRSWGEGVQVPADEGSPGLGAPAEAGEATWLYRFATGDPWSQPGGQSDADFASAVSSSAFVSGAGEQAMFPSTPALVADVQWWLDHSGENFGWMLATDSEALPKTARGFASRESGFGPTLTVEFTTAPGPGTSWRYTLVEGSTLVDDCPICDRLTIVRPLRGTFDLLLEQEGPLFTTYRITNIQFYANAKADPTYTVTGNGSYQVGGEVAIQQGMSLETEVCNTANSCRSVTFTNEPGAVTLRFPLIEISLAQTQENFVSFYTMHLVAAPAREIWFATTNGFAPTNAGPVVHAGDVLTQAGRIVRTSARLLETVGITNAPDSLHVDAFDIAPGGEIVFSLSQTVVSPTLGTLQEGDLLSSRGRIVKKNQELTAAFGIQPIVPDVGLDAVTVTSNGEILFSIRSDIFSESKGVLLHHGDVLSDQGQVVKTNPQLLARFHPTDTSKDYGLDALYVWPDGEMWFSTESGFVDEQLGAISDGDLLSTEGIIVFRNSELVGAFGAPESASGFGLSDIFVVTDLAVAGPPRFLSPRVQQDNLILQWTGTNRVFQVERTGMVTGRWQPLGTIDPDSFLIEPGVISSNAQSFYRLRAW